MTKKEPFKNSMRRLPRSYSDDLPLPFPKGSPPIPYPGSLPLRELYASLGRSETNVPINSPALRTNALQVFRILRLPPGDPPELDRCVVPSAGLLFDDSPVVFVKKMLVHMLKMDRFPPGHRLQRRCKCYNCYNPWHFQSAPESGNIDYVSTVNYVERLLDVERWRDSPYYDAHRTIPIDNPVPVKEFIEIWRKKG